MISAATTTHLVVRRHVDLGRTRSMICLASLTAAPARRAAALDTRRGARARLPSQGPTDPCLTSAPPPPPAARPHRDPAPQARRGPVGARLHRAAEQERAVQEGRRPAQRPRPDPEHLLQARLRLDRPGRPARPVPLDGPLHPARPGLRRRQDRDARGGGARRRVLHAAGPLRRRAARRRRQLRALGEHRRRLRPRHRRRHRPREHPVPLDPDRGRPGDLAAPRRRRPDQPGGVRRLAAPVPRLPRRRRRRRRDHRRHRGARRRSSAATSATRSTPTCRASSRPR